MDEAVPRVMAPLLTNLPNLISATAKRTVLEGASRDAAAGHSAILLYTNETFANFTLTTRFKIVSGATAPEAGIAFRLQDASNYYVLRASTRGTADIAREPALVRVVNGVRYDGQGKGVLCADSRWIPGRNCAWNASEAASAHS